MLADKLPIEREKHFKVLRAIRDKKLYTAGKIQKETQLSRFVIYKCLQDLYRWGYIDYYSQTYPTKWVYKLGAEY